MMGKSILDSLADRLRAGDERAGPEILEAVMPLMWSVCYEAAQMFGEDSRNLLSAVAAEVVASLSDLERGVTVGSWLFYLRKNARAAAIREARRIAPGRSLSGPSTRIGGVVSLDASLIPGELTTLHDIIPTPAREASNYEHIYRALARLKPTHRRVVELHFGLDGSGHRTQAESAAALGTTRQNVSLHIATAMRKLRSLLAEEIAMLGGLRALACAGLVLLISAPSAPALTYAEWIAGYPSLTGDAALATADPDGDGIQNLLEFALAAGDPTVPSSPEILPKLYQQTRNTDGTYNPPAAKLTAAERAAAATIHGVLRYQPREGVTGIRYIPMTNQVNLQDWGWGPSAFAPEWSDGGYTLARAHTDIAVWKTRAFLRLRVEIIP